MKATFISTPFILYTGNLVNNKDEVNKFKVLRKEKGWHTTVIAASRFTHVVHWASSTFERKYEAIP